jgi:crotonobetainyl-CoA:carnitine CoA-transferase CaiB-like acyl-CoA transferase
VSVPGDAARPTGPLAGVRVVELASEAGAFAAKMLADLGAEVIVVEPPGGHASRLFSPFFEDRPGPERSLWWWYYNTGKYSVTLDADDETDAALLRDLIGSGDVVLEAEPPGRLASLGLDYQDLSQGQPGLVWVSITAHGRNSPRVGEPATDLTIAADAGPAWSCGYDDHDLPPVRPGGPQSYHTACLWAVMGALTALFVRAERGRGQLVDVSMNAACNVTTEAATYEWLVAQATVQRQTFRHAAVRRTPPRLIQAGDGRYVINALPRSAHEFRAVQEWIVELGLAERVEDFVFLELAIERGGVSMTEVDADPEVAAMYQAGADALRAIAEHLPAKQFFLDAQRRGLAVGAVLAAEDVIEDEHYRSRGFPVSILHEDLGRSFFYPGAPFHASESPWRVRGRAPHVGEHQAAVLGDRALQNE